MRNQQIAKLKLHAEKASNALRALKTKLAPRFTPEKLAAYRKKASQWALTLLIGSFALHFAALSIIYLHAGAVYARRNLGPLVILVVLPTLILLCSVLVSTLESPVHALLSLIAVFFMAVVVYLFAGAQFLAYVFLIVYVGAIAILFLFVIRLLHSADKQVTKSVLKTPRSPKWTARLVNVPLYGYVFFTLGNLGGIFPQLTKGAFDNTFGVERLVRASQDDVHALDQLYSHYSALFVLVSLLLLTGRIGAIVLASSARENDAE